MSEGNKRPEERIVGNERMKLRDSATLTNIRLQAARMEDVRCEGGRGRGRELCRWDASGIRRERYSESSCKLEETDGRSSYRKQEDEMYGQLRCR